MFSPYSRFVSCLVIIWALSGKVSAFVSGPVRRLHHEHRIAASSRASYSDQLRSRGSLGALRMTEEDAKESAEVTAKRLTEQAAALREEVATSEAKLRPAEQAAEGVQKSAPEIRPEDMPPQIKLSDDMKNRLRQELISQGADPNKSVGNPILVVSAIIAVLVVIGGKGIFY